MAGVRALIDASVAAGNTPRVPARGKGLLLTVAGRRGLRLMDVHGDLTQAGQVYYEAVGVDPPDRRFDYTPEAAPAFRFGCGTARPRPFERGTISAVIGGSRASGLTTRSRRTILW